MTEVAKKIDGVMTFQARFWVGYHVIDGEARCLVPVTKVLPQGESGNAVKGAASAHNIKEFSNLNRILPAVYTENKDQW